MKNISYKAAALIISFSLITPLFASAQTVSASADVTSQIQSLASQISALEAQLRSLVSSAVGSTTMPMWNASSTRPTPPPMPMGTSTNMMMGGGSGNGMSAMRCLPIARDLSLGSQGSDVMQLQQILAGDGLFSASTTGFFGPLTAQAVANFQTRFDVTASSTGTVGPLTRAFLMRGGCGPNGAGRAGSQGNGMASTTSPWQGGTPPQPMWQQGSTTPPMGAGMRWNQGSSTYDGTNGSWMGATSTPPGPCMQPDMQNNSNLGNAAAVAASLFIPHALIPGMMHPCPPPPDVSGEMQQQ